MDNVVFDYRVSLDAVVMESQLFQYVAHSGILFKGCSVYLVKQVVFKCVIADIFCSGSRNTHIVIIGQNYYTEFSRSTFGGIFVGLFKRYNAYTLIINPNAEIN